MLAEKITWIGEPSEPDTGQQHILWPYTVRGNNIQFVMGRDEHNIYLAEKAILSQLGTILSLIVDGTREKIKNELLRSIRNYGEAIANERESQIRESYADAQ